MSINGFYVVEFGDVNGKQVNGGVAALKDGRVQGGDSGYYYVGEYAVSGSNFTSSLNVVKHNPTWESAFGDTASQFTLQITGIVNSSVMTGTLVRSGYPKLPVKLKRTADLL